MTSSVADYGTLEIDHPSDLLFEFAALSPSPIVQDALAALKTGTLDNKFFSQNFPVANS